MQIEVLWIGWLVAGGLTVILVGLMLRAGRRLRSLMDTPTSKARGVFIGQVELAGAARRAQPLRSYLAESECVWYRYRVEEEWERWETETYTDSKGNKQTRQVRKSGWSEVASGGEEPPFEVVDETGSVQVRPAGAEVNAERVFSRTVGRGDVLYYAKGPAGGISDSTGRRRFSESAIPQGAPVFVAGRARERDDVVAPEIAEDAEQEFFLIGTRGERSLTSKYRWQFWGCGVLQLLPLAVAWLFQSGEAPGLPQWWPAAAIVAAMALLWLVSWLWMAFNSLVRLRNRVDQAASLIDVQLKRRADLIPRLVETVAGLRDHERMVQAEIATLRTQAGATPKGSAGPDLAAAAGSLRAVVEKYPQLRSDGAFARLQRELADTETRLALARDYYNEIATHSNTRREIVPDCWISALAGLRHRQLWQAEGFTRAVPQVSLDAATP